MSLISIARQLIKSADNETLAKHSFANYHAVGIDYLCLHRSDRLTIKAYVFGENVRTVGWPTPLPQHWLVWPHNHRYAFDHTTIAGQIVNVTFSLGDDEMVDLYAYSAESRHPEIVGQALMSQTKFDATNPGESFSMHDPMELHTLIVREPSIAIQAQYHDTRKQTLMAVRRGMKVSCDTNQELYQRLYPYRVNQLRTMVRDALEKLP